MVLSSLVRLQQYCHVLTCTVTAQETREGRGGPFKQSGLRFANTPQLFMTNARKCGWQVAILTLPGDGPRSDRREVYGTTRGRQG